MSGSDSSERETVSSEQKKDVSRARDFRDLIAWQKAMSVVETVYKVSARFPDDERYGLTSQIRRAAVSIASNIAEGQGRGPGRAFANHLWIANGSLREVQTQVLIAVRLKFLPESAGDRLVADCEEVSRILVSLRRSISSD